MDTDKFNQPDYLRPEYIAQAPGRALCNAMMAGTTGVRALGEKGLPKWPGEKQANYTLRASATQVARYYMRTVHASTGMIVATPPALAPGANPVMTQDWEDIDGKGVHGEVFARELCATAINDGYCVILVDAPPVPTGAELTLADEQALGLRPFWVLVRADQILSWIVDVPDWAALLRDYTTRALTAEQVQSYAKQTILRQVVIHEPTDVATGTYGVKRADRYRVLRLTDAGVTFTVLERQEHQGGNGETVVTFASIASGVMLQAGRQPFREIPLAVVYAGSRQATFVAEPPLLALAELNLDHYQVSADRRYLMRLCHAPTLCLTGWDDEDDGSGQGTKKKIQVGPNSVLKTSNVQAKASYVAAAPDALQASKEEKDDLIDQMAALGMSFLARNQLITSETATARQLDDAAENATHATVARGLQDGLEQAMRYHAMYRGVPAPSVTVNTTYASPSVDPQVAAVLWQAVAADKLDIGSFITYIKTGELPEDVAMRLDVFRQLGQSAAQSDEDAEAGLLANARAAQLNPGLPVSPGIPVAA